MISKNLGFFPLISCLCRANLSHDYFTNRQDRYILFSDSRNLTDYFSELARTIAAHSYSVSPPTSLTPTLGFDHVTSVKNSRKYTKIFSDNIKQLLKNFAKNDTDKPLIVDSDDGMEKRGEWDTVVFPLLQMGQYGIRQEEEVTATLLERLRAEERLHLASGYFNLPPRYTQALLEAAGCVSILAASPQVGVSGTTLID